MRLTTLFRPPARLTRRGVAVGLIGAAAYALAGLIAWRTIGSPGHVLGELVGGILILGAMVLAFILSRRDTVSILTLLVVVLFLVPERYTIAGPLRAAGNPAVMLGTLCLGLWVVGRLMGWFRAVTMHPFRWAVWGFALAVGTSFAAGMARHLNDTESKSATRTLFSIVAMIGIAMLATDGLQTVGQVRTVLRRLVYLVTAQAAIGILEYVTSLDYFALAHVPGLVVNTEVSTDTRGGVVRVMGAAAHSIEFSVAIAAVAPLALHFALTDPDPRRRRIHQICFGIMLSVLPLPVSRSGLLGLMVGLAVYLVAMSRRARANLITLGVIGMAAFEGALPGLVGTLRYYIFAGSQDPSIQGRTDDYANLPGLMTGHWVFGRGFGTFQPSVYFFLDNQLLMTLITQGIVGLAAMVVIFVVGIGVARGVFRRLPDRVDRGLGQAIAGGLACLFVTAGTFDEFSFLQAGLEVVLLGGCAAALWSLSPPRSEPTPAVWTPPERTSAQPVTAGVAAT